MALAGSHKPLLVTSGFAGIAPGRHALETDGPDSHGLRKSDIAATRAAERGVLAASVRLSTSVHGAGDYGFIPILIRMAKEKGVSAYVDSGQNRWPGVHRKDAARLYRLALEKGVPLPVYHATADDGVAFKLIAEVIGRRLGVPVESLSREHFGWFARFAAADMPASSVKTRATLG